MGNMLFRTAAGFCHTRRVKRGWAERVTFLLRQPGISTAVQKHESSDLSCKSLVLVTFGKKQEGAGGWLKACMCGGMGADMAAALCVSRAGAQPSMPLRSEVDRALPPR